MDDLGAPYTPSEAHVSRIFDRLTSRIGAIFMSAADDAVNAATDQLVKAKGEIDAVIAELESQSVKPETVDRLKSVSQSLDDENPDQADTPPDAPANA